MDFGAILDEWDKQTAKPGARRAAGPESAAQVAPPPAREVDPLTAWLRINGVQDKDAGAEGAEVSSAARRNRLLKKRADAVVDLHGLTRDEAWVRLDLFFAQARREGAEKVLIVHGKGNHSDGEAILKRTVREYIERSAYTGESGQAPTALGGSGATWVVIKDGSKADYRSR
jgi:DNA-nicking Smr family endonuclease